MCENKIKLEKNESLELDQTCQGPVDQTPNEEVSAKTPKLIRGRQR